MSTDAIKNKIIYAFNLTSNIYDKINNIRFNFWKKTIIYAINQSIINSRQLIKTVFVYNRRVT